RHVTIRKLGIVLAMIVIYHLWQLNTSHFAVVPNAHVGESVPGNNDTGIEMDKVVEEAKNVSGSDAAVGKLQTAPGDSASELDLEAIHEAHSIVRGDTGILKVSMLFGAANAIYERSVKTHARHGYPTQVLRNEIVQGYWNKPSFLLAVLVLELAKPPEERMKWIL
ncbi:hypothetical protein GP486_008800, partial [Trichoglossum hirsutum]